MKASIIESVNLWSKRKLKVRPAHHQKFSSKKPAHYLMGCCTCWDLLVPLHVWGYSSWFSLSFYPDFCFVLQGFHHQGGSKHIHTACVDSWIAPHITTSCLCVFFGGGWLWQLVPVCPHHLGEYLVCFSHRLRRRLSLPALPLFFLSIRSITLVCFFPALPALRGIMVSVAPATSFVYLNTDASWISFLAWWFEFSSE